ncbi:hypothetical protein ACFQ5J_03275 [Lacticaseibacillus baoqingensis]|uniref:Uncharacterized protein n=1 Tax=Lacticaseibacillus baoqingensis TaxID=2486013 RepID=A0ABW4E6Z0_9LACO|nr:hypothetical protein [Lacticaseibacillus baoqingensis]
MTDRVQTLRFVGIVADAKRRLIRFADDHYQRVDTLTLGAYYYFDSHGRPLDWPAWTLLVAHNQNFIEHPGSIGIGDFLTASGKLTPVNLSKRLSDQRIVKHLENTQHRFVINRYSAWLTHLDQKPPILAATHRYLANLLAKFKHRQLDLGVLLTKTRQYLATNAYWLNYEFAGLLDDLRPVIKSTQNQIDAIMPAAFLITNAHRLKIARAYHRLEADWHPHGNDQSRAGDEAYRHTQFLQIEQHHAYRQFHQIPLAPDNYYHGKKFWDPIALNHFT